MSNPTFKEIEHKVNLVLCLIALAIALGVAVKTFANAESRVKSEFKVFKNDFAIEFKSVKSEVNTFISSAISADEDVHLNSVHAAQNTNVIKTNTLDISTPEISKLDKKGSAKTAGVSRDDSKTIGRSNEPQVSQNNKIKHINTMPVMDELAPAFKKTRLI